MHVKYSLILKIIGEMSEHNRQTMGIAQRNNAQVCKQNGISPPPDL